MSNTPFKLRSGNKPPFKKMGSSPLQDDKGDGNHPMHHEGAGGTLKELEELYEHRGYRTKKEEMEMELKPDAPKKTKKADPKEGETQEIKKDKQGRPKRKMEKLLRKIEKEGKRIKREKPVGGDPGFGPKY